MRQHVRARSPGGLKTAIALLAIGLTMVPAVAHAQTTRGVSAASSDASGLYARPQLDGLSVTMAYDRLNGTTPDFRPYAERSGSYVNATVFDRPAVLDREIARLQEAFRTFDLNRVYSMRINVPVEQYDPGRQGYPIGFGPSSEIGFKDPVMFHNYALAFRNADAVDFLAVGDAASARAFSEANGFDMQGDTAGSATLQVAFRLADAPPTLAGGPDTVRADILAARLLGQNGTVIHDFGKLAPLEGATTRGVSGSPVVPVLKTADVQGFHVGMSEKEAEAQASHGWATKLGPDGLNVIALFDGLQPKTATWVRCGSLEVGSPDPNAVYAGQASPPPFRNCLAVRLDGVATASSRMVDALVSREHLGAADPGPVLAALRAKYGTPIYVRDNGANLVWLGRDPSRTGASSVQITADVRNEYAPTGGQETVLTVEETPYLDPRAKPAAPAAATAAKL